ncbi:MAG: hypothetical protein PWP03_754 [Candidatus Woesearchaeota archaeon]|nr:hypothetical protein [Candidatus Woesearchaeota archaeon]MDN5328116.1 hypothetical protein [Candidatus Woesearchaeota archaeon]
MFDNMKFEDVFRCRVFFTISLARALSVFLALVFLLNFLAIDVFADELPARVNVLAGRSYYVKLESFSRTDHWAGMIIENNGLDLSETNEPFLSLSLTDPIVTTHYFPGDNLNDGVHYYAAMPFYTTFSVNNVYNVSFSDLEKDGLFNSELYPEFYDNYYSFSDNPKITFSSGFYDYVNISGHIFQGIAITLDPGTKMVLLKYYNGSTYVPLFVSELKNQLCANNNICISQFMLPIASKDYSFYILSKLPVVDFDVFIDGVQTDHFSQTALPYVVRVKAYYIYEGNAPAKNIDIVIGEEDGQNLFIPTRLQGYVSLAYSQGQTDDTGEETFLIAPTIYPSSDTYKIFVAYLYGDSIVSRKTLYVDSKDELLYISKPLSPDTLYDNAKISVNEMNQIISFLYKWSSVLQQAYSFNVNYEISTDSVSVSSYPDFGGQLLLKTGAPNIISVTVTNNGFPVSNYFVRIKETGGYLIMNPYNSNVPLDPKVKYKEILIPTGQQFVITPTSRPASNSVVELEILDSNYNLLKTITASINNDLNIDMGGTFYSDDTLKVITNAMNQVLSSLFYSLNN